MKKLQGYSKNINNPILGKVKCGNNIFHYFEKDNILITANLPKTLFKYKAVVTNISDIDIMNKINYPIIYGVEDVQELDDGDVLLLEKDGRINVLFDNSSNDNCLLITEKCNCNCIMCPQENKGQGNSWLNIKIIDLISKKTKYVGLTGGEPTLLKGNLIEIIKKCKHQLPNTSIALLTNGILFDELTFVEEIVSINHPSLIFQIPLYSDNDEEHNDIIQAKGFYKTINGLYNLAMFRQKIEIRNVIQKINYKRLPQYADFIYRKFPFVFHVALMGLEFEGKAQKVVSDLWIDPFNYADELERAVIYLHRAYINVSIYNHQLCILPKKLWLFAKKSISSWKNIYLEVCEKCDYRGKCGGFFKSSTVKRSDYIKPLKDYR